MINYFSARPYITYPGFLFPKNDKHPVVLVYFSENSELFDDFRFLKLRKIDFRHIKIPTTRVPRTYLTGEQRKKWRNDFGVLAYKEDQSIPRGMNYIYDISTFLTELDRKYKPRSYRHRFANIITSMIDRGFKHTKGFKKVLFYSVRLDKPFNSSYVNRKIYALEEQLRQANFIFDDLVLIVLTPNGARFRILIRDREYTFTRVKKYLRSVSEIDKSADSKKKVEDNVDEIIKSSSVNFSGEQKEVVANAVSQLITQDPTIVDEISMGFGEDHAVKKSTRSNKSDEIIAIAMVAASNGDVERSKKLVAVALQDKTPKQVLDLVNKNLIDDLLKYEKPVVDNDDPLLSTVDLAKATGERSPGHILNKRKKDFQENLTKDIKATFDSLKNKDIPITVKSVKFEEVETDPKNLAKTDIVKVKITLIGYGKKEHQIEVHIPKIHEDGTFWINGKRKCLLNQIVLLPITFPKPFMAKFESSYSAFHIYSKFLRGNFHLEIYMGTYKLPLPHVMFFAFGFDHTLKLLSLKYKIVDSISKDDQYYMPLKNNKYLLFGEFDGTELKKQFLYTIMKYPLKPIGEHHIFDKEYWPKIIIQETGRVNSVYFIQNNIDNIVDSVCKQILKTKALPTRLDHIMLYMAFKAVGGYVMKRNDLDNQRIRSSEIVVHLLQKQILTSYTIYKERTLAGDTDAKFEINPTKVLSEFMTSEVVANMEYANPVEELSMMTRVTPIGKKIGGIPDKRAITDESRNLSKSYYGNIDPVDTPESGTVGVTQHLALGAAITSGRGLFKNHDFKNGLDSGTLSTSSVLVPFVQNNDGNRVMFGVGQMKQSVPLSNPEPPAVQTGFESILTSSLSDHFIKRSPCDGKIVEVKDDSIIVQCGKSKKKEIVDITPVHLSSGSGKDTLSTFRAKVKVGQNVKQNQRIAEGGCISDGFMSLGRTLCTAVMTYKGYNFEDGIVISEKVAAQEKLASEHGVVEEVEISPNDKVLFIENIGVDTEKGQMLLQKSIGELDELLGYGEEDTNILEDVVDGKLIRKSPGGKIVDIEVFSNLPDDKQPDILKPLIQRTNKKYRASNSRTKYRLKKGIIQGTLIRFKINQKYNITIGDKLTNRHGAKGIVSLIEKEEYMPLTPWGDRVEIIVNPIGIINRMNIGQLFELYCGAISRAMAIFILQNKTKKSAIINMIQKVIGHLDKTDNKVILSSMIASINRMSSTKMDQFISELEKRPFYPIIIPPFKSPKQSDIKKAMAVLGLKDSYNILLPEFQVKTIQPVPLGYMYIEKLEHMASLKLHARSVGPTTNKTGQPTAGKRRGGGQRVGEQDVYSLLSHNCYTTLSEIFGPLSDDKNAKNEEIANIMRNGYTKLVKSKKTPTRELLNYYFTALMLERK